MYIYTYICTFPTMYIYICLTTTTYVIYWHVALYIRRRCMHFFSWCLLQGYNPSLTSTVLTNCIPPVGNFLSFFLSFLDYVKQNKGISFLGNNFLRSNKWHHLANWNREQQGRQFISSYTTEQFKSAGYWGVPFDFLSMKWKPLPYEIIWLCKTCCP